MLHTVVALCFASILGVVSATSLTCGVGLFSGTNTWCEGLPLFWIVGFPAAILSALILGFPAVIVFRKLRLTQWWQFVIVATLAAVPLWFGLAQPLDSPRWQHAGFFDSLNYLGSGGFAGLFYWWFAMKVCAQPSNSSLDTDTQACRSTQR